MTKHVWRRSCQEPLEIYSCWPCDDKSGAGKMDQFFQQMHIKLWEAGLQSTGNRINTLLQQRKSSGNGFATPSGKGLASERKKTDKSGWIIDIGITETGYAYRYMHGSGCFSFTRHPSTQKTFHNLGLFQLVTPGDKEGWHVVGELWSLPKRVNDGKRYPRLFVRGSTNLQ